MAFFEFLEVNEMEHYKIHVELGALIIEDSCRINKEKADKNKKERWPTQWKHQPQDKKERQKLTNQWLNAHILFENIWVKKHEKLAKTVTEEVIKSR